jgi:hypothetical protein
VLSEVPEIKEKQLANLQHEYGNKILREIQESNKKEVIERLLQLAPSCYPNVSKLAKEANISRAYARYLIDTDSDFKLQLEEHFKAKLDRIEENVLNTAEKEQYAGIAIGVLNKLHPRYKEEKQSIQANIQVNIGGMANPYQQSEIDSNDSREE